MNGGRTVEAVVIGCSFGGLRAVEILLAGLAPTLTAGVVIACHSASEDIGDFCEIIARRSSLPVAEARERVALRGGSVWVAPTGYHLYIERDRRFALSIDPRVCFSRPSIDVLFESAAAAYGSSLAAVVLTGANEDGAAGLRSVRELGGYALVQEPGDAEAPQMPRAALERAGADFVEPLNQLATVINRLCRH